MHVATCLIPSERAAIAAPSWALGLSVTAVDDLSVLQLRELVPPSASVKGPDGGDIKRPKHVVLSDTIALLRHLKEKVCPTQSQQAARFGRVALLLTHMWCKAKLPVVASDCLQ